MKIDPRFASWRFVIALTALLMLAHTVTHRIRAGTWAWDAESWVPLVLGTILGIVIFRVLVLWLLRRQRTRNRPST